MIESVFIHGSDAPASKMKPFIYVKFTDGTFVSLSEEELKNAAALAEKGCLHN